MSASIICAPRVMRGRASIRHQVDSEALYELDPVIKIRGRCAELVTSRSMWRHKPPSLSPSSRVIQRRFLFVETRMLYGTTVTNKKTALVGMADSAGWRGVVRGWAV